MPVEAQFLLIALVIFLWESLLWLPMRTVVLRRRWRGGRWKKFMPGDLFTARGLGVLPLLPAPLDGELAPCQSPPLLPVEGDGVYLENSEGYFQNLGRLKWEDLNKDDHHLLVKGRKIRVSSPRCLEDLSRAKRRGLSLPAALQRQWRRTFSPVRALREWRRWRLVSLQLRLLGPLLTHGFFVGLPLFYLHGNLRQAALFAAWLWLLMILISLQLWWLGRRVYPAARSPLRMNALLALVVPFHAMRAAEIAAVHAMATIHPAALLLATGDRRNPWLAAFSRRLLFPSPGNSGDAAFSSLVLPLLEKHLDVREFPAAPDREGDEESTRYCPRCHGLFLAPTHECSDCKGVVLRELEPSSGKSPQANV